MPVLASVIITVAAVAQCRDLVTIPDASIAGGRRTAPCPRAPDPGESWPAESRSAIWGHSSFLFPFEEVWIVCYTHWLDLTGDFTPSFIVDRHGIVIGRPGRDPRSEMPRLVPLHPRILSLLSSHRNYDAVIMTVSSGCYYH